MIYIFCAFEAEARALIDSYKLIKKQSVPFVLFSNESIQLILSGMGQQKAKEAAEYLLTLHTIQNTDIFLNIGVCAAKENYKIGELLEVNQIHDETNTYPLQSHSSILKPVTCFSASQAQGKGRDSDIAEMEALGLYLVLKDDFISDRISFLKIVSDNFKPFIPKKSFIIGLIQARVKEIKEHIQNLQGEHLVR